MRHSFFCIDAHTCGNPVRLVAGGGPLLPHLPIAERRDIFVRDHDWVRKALMFEPRGHDIMSGAIIYPAYRGVHHIIWCDRATTPMADGRCAVFYGDKAIDRSPGGTGTSARMAQLHAKGRLPVGARFRHESLIGTTFDGRVEAVARVGPYDGIMPSVAGWARIIGHNTIFVDDRDPLAHGFQIR